MPKMVTRQFTRNTGFSAGVRSKQMAKGYFATFPEWLAPEIDDLTAAIELVNNQIHWTQNDRLVIAGQAGKERHRLIKKYGQIAYFD